MPVIIAFILGLIPTLFRLVITDFVLKYAQHVYGKLFNKKTLPVVKPKVKPRAKPKPKNFR